MILAHADLNLESSTLSTHNHSLTLVIPGLQGVTELPRAGHAEPQSRSLARWLGRGTRLRDVPSGYERMLLALAGYLLDPAEDAPVAALARLGEGQSPQSGWWIRADPIHLRADRDRLILFPPAVLDLTAAEAISLADACNPLFAGDGWRLEALHPRRWYLHLDENPGLRTYDLDEAVGKAIADFLPRGPQRRRWQTVLTEVQMVLHGAEANLARQSRGRLIANGVWLWGSGPLPPAQPLPWRSVWADESFAVGLARHSQVPCERPAHCAAVIEAARSRPALVVLHEVRDAWASGDTAHYMAAVKAACDDWITPVYEAVRSGRVASALLATDRGLAFSLDKAGLRRFWRRARRLTDRYATLAVGD